ncbi:pyridoxamine 5'-phosphate oxidase [Streptomyces venezuelae]|uniref:pyridoxamine 5'-phosphate oxidase n=1 Tax=Streptomyces venezuelae TaxID=54571 RepID=UPI00278C730F|nr:pyridoxamine 5'-phosphate oxidase [Streptomyces venezuelae]
MREQYRTTELSASDLAPEPIAQFTRWFKETAANPAIHEPNAMIVSTAGADGRPSSRTVLLKHYDRAGFVFFTNYDSRKGAELAVNPYASLLFPWHPLARQVIVTGRAERVGRDETVAYFRTRPHGSQLGAWASPQSSVIGSRAELLARYEELAARYPEGSQVPVPPEWGGIRVVPDAIEFWQGHENRLHDRLRYVREEGPGGASGETWRVARLAP